MAKMRIVTPVYEQVSDVQHKEHQEINTRVSHYLRMYATGKISEFPTNGKVQNATLPDDLRNDLLNRNLPLPELGTDPVEVLGYLQAHREEFENLAEDYNLAVDDAEKYNEAMSVLNDQNADVADVDAALRVVEAIRQKARARAN